MLNTIEPITLKFIPVIPAKSGASEHQIKEGVSHLDRIMTSQQSRASGINDVEQRAPESVDGPLRWKVGAA